MYHTSEAFFTKTELHTDLYISQGHKQQPRTYSMHFTTQLLNDTFNTSSKTA